MQLEDRGGVGLQELQQMAYEIVEDGNGQSGLTNLNTSFRANVPQLFAEVDRTKAKTLFYNDLGPSVAKGQRTVTSPQVTELG